MKAFVVPKMRELRWWYCEKTTKMLTEPMLITYSMNNDFYGLKETFRSKGYLPKLGYIKYTEDRTTKKIEWDTNCPFIWKRYKFVLSNKAKQNFERRQLNIEEQPTLFGG